MFISYLSVSFYFPRKLSSTTGKREQVGDVKRTNAGKSDLVTGISASRILIAFKLRYILMIYFLLFM